MKIYFFCNSKHLKLSLKSGQKLVQKFPIILSGCICIPTKELLVNTIFHCHYLWRCFCSPLRKQMRTFKIFYPTFYRHLHPSMEISKSEVIFFIGNRDIYKLYRQPFSTNCRIKRRCEYWCQEHIAFMFHCRLNIRTHNFPILF